MYGCQSADWRLLLQAICLRRLSSERSKGSFMKKQYLRLFALFLVLSIAFVAVLVPVNSTAYAQENCPNWQGNYLKNKNFSGNPTLVVTDPAIDFYLIFGSAEP